MRKYYLFLCRRMIIICMLLFAIPIICIAQKSKVGLSLIPPGSITNKVDLDIRAGIVNEDDKKKDLSVYIYLNDEDDKSLLHFSKIALNPGEVYKVQMNLKTADKVGKHKIILKVKGLDEKYIKDKEIEIIDSEIRSTRKIEGAWVGICHWSDIEAKSWNSDIKKMTDDQWKEMIRAMHSINMDIVVIQESFRSQVYVGQHSLTVENYEGPAFYPSDLYPARVPITAKDPIEAILSEADKHGMSVMVGVGMFAYFDFTKESLEWHKRVAKELWDKYGHHPSFYAFYVSEECAGTLHAFETTEEGKAKRRKEISDFFLQFKKYCNSFAPDKPIMLATNSMGVLDGEDSYPALLQNLDILCPFGFARMPEDDMTGMEAADKLQKLCNDAGSHLWFDLEAFLFNPDNSLYPRPMEQIMKDLNLLDNFEKVLCYQFPGVFSDPKMSIRIGEERTLKLFKDYEQYLYKLKNGRDKSVLKNNK